MYTKELQYNLGPLEIKERAFEWKELYDVQTKIVAIFQWYRWILQPIILTMTFSSWDQKVGMVTDNNTVVNSNHSFAGSKVAQACFQQDLDSIFAGIDKWQVTTGQYPTWDSLNTYSS